MQLQGDAAMSASARPPAPAELLEIWEAATPEQRRKLARIVRLAARAGHDATLNRRMQHAESSDELLSILEEHTREH